MTNIGGFTEKQAELVARAFWRRIYPYRNDYGKELPDECPVEFAANMAIALCALDNNGNASAGIREAVRISEGRG